VEGMSVRGERFVIWTAFSGLVRSVDICTTQVQDALSRVLRQRSSQWRVLVPVLNCFSLVFRVFGDRARGNGAADGERGSCMCHRHIRLIRCVDSTCGWKSSRMPLLGSTEVVSALWHVQRIDQSGPMRGGSSPK